MRVASLLFAAFCLAGPSSSSVFAAENVKAGANGDVGDLVRFKVEKFSLPNGLTVLLHENHSSPIISYQTWFRVGSKNEHPGLTGIAHLFEHMMFKGAKRYSGEQFDLTLQANGATNNAFTTQDYTGYYENFPSSKLELIIDIESDRMENLRISAENLKSERDVVKEERRFRVDNNPMGILRETLFATTFRVHPYRWPVIGYMRDLDNVTPENAASFYRTYYAPNNATVVIAGDFDPKEARRLIEKAYSPLASQTLPEPKIEPEPKQTSARTQVISHDVQSTQFALSYQTPKAGTDESYALDLLANVLGNGMSSRLYQRLVYKEQNVASVVAANVTLQDAGQFQVYVTMKPGQHYAAAERAVLGELWRPRNLLINADELAKAKNQVMKSYVDSLKTIHGKAEALAMNETLFRNYEELFKDLGRYEKVTSENIRDVAKKYLNPMQATLVVLKPKTGGKK